MNWLFILGYIGLQLCIGLWISKRIHSESDYFLGGRNVSLLLAGKLRRGNYVTLADYYRERYGSFVEKFAVWIMVPSSLIWGAAQIRAFG